MIRILPDQERVAWAAARIVVSLLRKHAQSDRRPVTLVLSGGRSPRRMYELLAGETGAQIPWGEIALLWGDERCVSPEDERSNYHLAASTGLLAKPWAVIQRMAAESDPERGAKAYEATVRGLFPAQSLPRLDVVLLGLGDDGHIASLFPGSPALAETKRLAVATEKRDGVRRLTLTLPILARARDLLFVVTGKAKASTVRLALDEKDPPGVAIPARLLREMAEAQRATGRSRSTITWVLDEAAASLLAGAPGRLDGGSVSR